MIYSDSSIKYLRGNVETESLARPEIVLLSSGDPRIFPSCELWYDTIRLQLNRAKVKMRFFIMHYAVYGTERLGTEATPCIMHRLHHSA